jgi:hypothetical protein
VLPVVSLAVTLLALAPIRDAGMLEPLRARAREVDGAFGPAFLVFIVALIAAGVLRRWARRLVWPLRLVGAAALALMALPSLGLDLTVFNPRGPALARVTAVADATVAEVEKPHAPPAATPGRADVLVTTPTFRPAILPAPPAVKSALPAVAAPGR